MKLTSWSFSRYNLYKQCPLKCKLIHIDKLKEPPSEAMARGTRIHELAENYIKGALPAKPFPEELRLFRSEIVKLRNLFKKGHVTVEDNWAFDPAWAKADWFKGWVRVKLDCAHIVKDTAIITDWKTGKFRPEQNDSYVEQLELYALASLLWFPKGPGKVKPRLVYLDEGTIFPAPGERNSVLAKGYTQDDVPSLINQWEARVRPMLCDEQFAPKPNRFCSWCAFSKAKGGPCQF